MTTAAVLPSSDRLGRVGEDRLEVEGADALDEDEERERERRVADRVHDERLLPGLDGRAPEVPEVDQEVGGEADHAPAGEQEQQVAGLDEQEHREDEERLVRVVAPLLLVAVHVADGVGEDQEAHAGDDEHHEDRERVDRDLGAEAQVARREPRPERRRVLALLGAVAEEQKKTTRAQTKEMPVAPEAITPAVKRLMRVPASAIATTAAAGAKRQIQAAGVTGPVSPGAT